MFSRYRWSAAALRKKSSRIHFVNYFSITIQIRWKCQVVPIQILITWSLKCCDFLLLYFFHFLCVCVLRNVLYDYVTRTKWLNKQDIVLCPWRERFAVVAGAKIVIWWQGNAECTGSVLMFQERLISSVNDDVIKWKHFPRYWSFVRGIHRSPANFPHKSQWRGALTFFFDLRLNKRLSKQSWGWWFKTPSSNWRHCNAYLDFQW